MQKIEKNAKSERGIEPQFSDHKFSVITTIIVRKSASSKANHLRPLVVYFCLQILKFSAFLDSPVFFEIFKANFHAIDSRNPAELYFLSSVNLRSNFTQCQVKKFVK